MNLPNTIKQLSKFGVVGVVNTSITLSSFYFMHEILKFNYIIVSIVAYSFGFLSSYLGNKFWTFKVTDSDIKQEIGKFITVNLIGLGLNVLFISGFVELLEIQPLIAQIFTICLVVIFNFSGNKFWVFKSK